MTFSPTGRQHRIEVGDHSAVVVAVGGGVREYTVAGVPVLRGYAEHESPPMAAGTLLAPWPNRIAGGRYTFGGREHQLALTEPAAGNAIHGLARSVEWAQEGREADAVTMGVDVMPQQGYPFAIRLMVRWSVGPDGLRAEHTAVNIGEGPAPFGLGAHPYLDLCGTALADAQVRIPAAQYLPADEHGIPAQARPVEGTEFDFRTARRLGDTRLDTAYGGVQHDPDGHARATLTRADGATATIWVDESFGYLQVFTPDDVGGGGPAVAIEPMTCAPDAFNSGAGLLVLEPGEQWRGSWGVSVK